MTAAPSQSKALRRIFLAIFLRGRSARGLQKDKAPKSIGSKLLLTLVFYALFGAFATFFIKQSLFGLSLYLHASTLMFTGMFVATSAGEALFNKEEADILLHRPVTPQALLWAKVSVIVQISLWLAACFNLVGFIIGTTTSGPLFLIGHVISLILSALFIVGLVVVTYQLCLRWFGRERLDALITTMQTFMAVGIVLGSQLAPQLLMRHQGNLNNVFKAWWILLLPPAWFAGFDDALAGTGSAGSWALAGIATVATGILLWAGFGTLAKDYAAGLQTLQEAAPSNSGRRPRRRMMERLVHTAPLRWWLRDSVTRAAFLLSTAYLARDRDTKLRVFPGIAPVIVMPIIFLMPGRAAAGPQGDFGIAFAGCYMGLIPMLGLGLLKYSQQWQASDIFRAAPLAGPAPLCHGARKAMLFFVTVPMLLIISVAAFWLGSGLETLKMLLPGLIALPVFAMVPCVNADAVPLSEPPEEAKQASRGLKTVGVMFIALAIAGVALAANHFGFFSYFLIAEALLAAAAYSVMRHQCERAKWEE